LKITKKDEESTKEVHRQKLSDIITRGERREDQWDLPKR